MTHFSCSCECFIGILSKSLSGSEKIISQRNEGEKIPIHDHA